MQTLIDDIALQLGLPPAGATEYPAESDHGLIATKLNANHHTTLQRGWWFNSTCEKVEPMSIGVVIAPPGALRVIARRHQEYAPQVRFNEPWVDETTGRYLYDMTNASEEFEQPFDAEIRYWRPLDECPEEYLTYLTWKTVNQLAKFFGVPTEDDREAAAWTDLLRANAAASSKTNVFSTNPYLYRTTRRR